MVTKWEQRFWELAKFVSEWSKDPNAKVGAVVANEQGVIALGYNGFPKGVEDSAERLKNQKLKLSMVVHAEQNALLLAGQNARGADIFVRGKPICSACAGLIIQAGIRRVIGLDPATTPNDSKWKKPATCAVKMLREAHVGVKFLA